VKHKNGFTILELIIGMAILSIATVFMLVTIVDLKNTEQANGVDTKAMLNQAIISSKINNDIVEKGLLSIEAQKETETNVLSAYTLTFNDNTQKELVIYNKDANDTQKAISIYYSKLSDTDSEETNSTAVDFRRTLPDGYYYSAIDVLIDTPTFKKVIIPVSNGKHDYSIELYFYQRQ